jgi:hypothetical protein
VNPKFHTNRPSCLRSRIAVPWVTVANAMTHAIFLPRFAKGSPLNDPDMSTAYTPGAKGYTDYPLAG